MSDNRIVSSIGKNYTIAYDGNRNLTSFNHIKTDVDDTINKSIQLNAVVEEINLSDEFIGEKINTEITIEEYKEMLVKSGFYEADINRLLSGEINAQELIDEIMNDFDNTSRIENLLSVSYLRAYGLEYANMNELLASINEKNIQIEKIESDRNSLQQTTREKQDMLEIIKGLQQGFSLEQILSMPMWQYIDENGNIQYTLVEDPNLIDSSGKYSYKKVTYGFLYEDSILLEELKKLASTQKSILGFEWDSYKWTNTDEQNAFLQKLMQESERLTSEVTNLNNQLNELKQQILTNQSIYDYINNEVVVYINNNKYISRDDFETNNQFNTSCLNTINQIKEKSNLMTSVNGEIPILYVSDKSDIVDVISCLINGDGSLSGGYFVNETSTLIKVNSTDNMIEHYVKWAEFLTEEEKEVFNYIYNTEGTDAAYTYLEFISSELDQQWLNKKIEGDQELASEYPWLTSIASIFVTPVEGMSAFYYSMNSLINGDKIRRTDVYSAGNIWRGQVAQDIYNYWKENENETLGSALSFAYNTGMSMADSVTLIGANVATGGTMAPVLSVSLMGSRSYVSTLNDALDRGMSDGSAIALAFSSAVVESAMENYSLGHLMDLESKLGETTLKLAEKIASKVSNEKVATIVTKAFYLGANALSQGLAEGEEEFATEILNYVADIFIAKDLSNYSLSIENYLAQGYTEEEALLQTMKDFSVQAFQAFTGGFASGVCFGSFSGTSSTIKTSYAMSQQMYTDLKGTTEATQFVEAIRKNQAQIENYQETIEALKKGETLTTEQVNLITKGTIEQQAGVAIKEEINQKLLNLRNNFNQENNLKYKLSDRKWSNKYYKELAQSYDDLSFLSQNTGKHLEEIFFDNENVIGIHRCGMMDAERIMDDGLLLTGHLSSGMSQNQSNFKLGRNISFYDKTEMGYLNFIRELKNAGAYKTLDGTGDVIIVSIPKSEIVYDFLGGVTFKNPSSAIDFSGVTPKLSSEYLLGYLNSSPDVLSDIKFNSKTEVGSMEQSGSSSELFSQFKNHKIKTNFNNDVGVNQGKHILNVKNEITGKHNTNTTLDNFIEQLGNSKGRRLLSLYASTGNINHIPVEFQSQIANISLSDIKTYLNPDKTNIETQFFAYSSIDEILNDKTPQEKFEYIKENIEHLNEFYNSKVIQDFMNEYFGANTRLFTNYIINNLNQENISDNLIDLILNLDDSQFKTFVYCSENNALYMNEQIFNRAIDTGINFIYGLDDNIKLKIIKNETYVNNIKDNENQISKLLTIIPKEYINTFLEKINFDSKSVSSKLEIIMNIDESIDAKMQKFIIEKSKILDSIELIDEYDIKSLIKGIKDKTYLYQIFNNEKFYQSLFSVKYNWENKKIYNLIAYLNPQDQIKFINENKIKIFTNITKNEMNELMKSVSKETIEQILINYPKISSHLNYDTWLEIYLKTNNELYFEQFKNMFLALDFKSYPPYALKDLKNKLVSTNLLEKFTNEELQQIYSYSTLENILDFMNTAEQIQYKTFFENMIDDYIENSLEINLSTLEKHIEKFTEIQIDKIISKIKIDSMYNFKKIVNKLNSKQIEMVLSKISIDKLIKCIDNEIIYNYVLEQVKKDSTILRDLDLDLELTMLFLSEEEKIKIQNLIENIPLEDKINFISTSMLKNDIFREQMQNLILTKPELLPNITQAGLKSLMNTFTEQQRILLYDKIQPDFLVSLYSNDLSIEEKNILKQLMLNKIQEMGVRNKIKLLEKLTNEEQTDFINKLTYSDFERWTFENLLKSIKGNDNLVILLENIFPTESISKLNTNDVIKILSKMDQETLTTFINFCPNELLIKSLAVYKNDIIENEVVKRFETNKELFIYSDSDLAYSKLTNDGKLKIDTSIEQLIYELNIPNGSKLLSNATILQKTIFIKEYKTGIITEEKINLLTKIKEKNIFVLSTFNYQLFDDTIYQFGPNLLTKLSKYYDVVDQIVALKQSPEKFNLFANMIMNDKTSSMLVADQKMAMVLDYLLNNEIDSTLLTVTNLTELETAVNIILKEIDQFSILGKDMKEVVRDRSIIKPDEYSLSNYQAKLAEKCDALLQKATTPEEVQNLIFNKYFSMSIEDATELFRMYGSRFADIKDLDTTGIATTYLENIQNILNISTIEEAKDFYSSFNSDSRYTTSEMLNIINEIKQIYTKSLKNTLFNPTNITGYVEYNGQMIPIYEPQGDFQMLVQSTYTNYGGMPIINDNYFDSWNLSSRTANHGICCSLISNNNMGMAMVKGSGVVIGFNSFTDEQMNMMAPYDIYTRNDGYLIKCQRPLLYLPGNEVMNETRHTHNEFNLERTNLTGEGQLANIQPDYVVVFEEMTEDLKQNAYKASIEFNVPLVYINKTTLAINESKKIDNLITEYNDTGNVELLKQILVLHENNRSGYRAGNPELVATYFPSDKIETVLEDGIFKSESQEDLLFIKEFLSDELSKFDVTYEATHRANIIDISISKLIEQINQKLNSIF